MSKRPPLDLLELTSGFAEPMPEAVQRVSRVPAQERPRPQSEPQQNQAKTEDLVTLGFKIAPAFKKRFKQCAVTADLKLNELLFEALDAWEEKRGLKS